MLYEVITTSLDLVSVNEPDRCRRVVTPTLPYVDYLIINELEAETLTGLKLRTETGELDTILLPHAAKQLLSQGVNDTVVIHCPEGAWADRITSYNVCYTKLLRWLVVIGFAVIGICWFILRKTTLGLHVYAVGGNANAARLTGIKVGLVLTFVYALSGLLSGLGGVMSASRLYSANGNLGVGYELDAIAAVVLGGTSLAGGIGTITGTLIGALIIAAMNNGMTLMGVSYFWQLRNNFV